MQVQEQMESNLKQHVEQLESKFKHVRSDYEHLQLHFDEAQDQAVDLQAAHDQTSTPHIWLPQLDLLCATL